MAKNQQVIVTITLALLIIIAVVVVAYVNLSEPTDQEQKDTNEDNKIDQTPSVFTWIINQTNTETIFNLTELEELNSVTGQGRYIKTKLLPDTVLIEDAHNYTGIPITSFLNEMNDIPSNYTLLVTASDGWESEYSMNQVNGSVDIYNENGSVIENNTATMILAYKIDGQYYSEIDPDNEIGPFRIAFIGDDNPITSSDLWSKMVVSIEIIAQP
jgi:hypothetical protein